MPLWEVLTKPIHHGQDPFPKWAPDDKGTCSPTMARLNLDVSGISDIKGNAQSCPQPIKAQGI